MWLGILICFIVYVIYCFLYGTPLQSSNKRKKKIYQPYFIRKNLPRLLADKYIIEINKIEYDYNYFEEIKLKSIIKLTNMLCRQEMSEGYLSINNRQYMILDLYDTELYRSVFSLLDIDTDEQVYLEINESNLFKFKFEIF